MPGLQLDACMKCGVKHSPHSSGLCMGCRTRKCSVEGCDNTWVPRLNSKAVRCPKCVEKAVGKKYGPRVYDV